jgi:hypothetical protein
MADPKIHDFKAVLKELPELSNSDLASAVLSTYSKISLRRLGGLADSVNLKPLISSREKIVVLPSTYERSDNAIMHFTAKLATQLGYRVKIAQYGNRTIRELTDHQQKVNLGLYMSLDDRTAMVRFTKKVDPYEMGRVLVRSQQIIGLLSQDEKLGVNILTENNRLFGNAKSYDSRKKVGAADQYWLRELPLFFEEADWGDPLANVLSTLMKQSYRLVDEEVIFNNLVPYIQTYPSFVQRTQKKEIVISPAKGRRPAVTSVKVPSKPKKNALLLDSEMKLLMEVSTGIWKPTPFEGISHEDWATAILENGSKTIEQELDKIYNARSQFLSKLASVTTKRLQGIRLLNETLKTKRKADITSTNLVELLLSRDDPWADFAHEITLMDPTGNSFLKEWTIGGKNKSFINDTSKDVVEKIYWNVWDRAMKMGLYLKELEARERISQQLTEARAKAENEAAADKAWRDSFKEKYGTTVYEQYAHLRKDNWGEAPTLLPKSRKRKAVNISHVIPHELQKPATYQPRKGKMKAEVIEPRVHPEGVRNFVYGTDEERGKFFLSRCKLYEDDEDYTGNEPVLYSVYDTYIKFGIVPSSYKYMQASLDLRKEVDFGTEFVEEWDSRMGGSD